MNRYNGNGHPSAWIGVMFILLFAMLLVAAALGLFPENEKLPPSGMAPMMAIIPLTPELLSSLQKRITEARERINWRTGLSKWHLWYAEDENMIKGVRDGVVIGIKLVDAWDDSFKALDFVTKNIDELSAPLYEQEEPDVHSTEHDESGS